MFRRGSVIAGLVLIAIGVGFAALSKEWIEEAVGVEPDGGSGLVEFLFAIVPIVAGVALLAAALVRSFERGGCLRTPEGGVTHGR